MKRNLVVLLRKRKKNKENDDNKENENENENGNEKEKEKEKDMYNKKMTDNTNFDYITLVEILTKYEIHRLGSKVNEKFNTLKNNISKDCLRFLERMISFFLITWNQLLLLIM